MKLTLKRPDHSTDLFLELKLDKKALTGTELRILIADMYDFNPNLQMVHAGKIIKDDDLFTLDEATIILVKWKLQLAPGPLFLWIQRIASKNPYFLSYLAVKPSKALEILEQESSEHPDLFNALLLKNN
jgi:hypothetical protein